MDKIKELFHKNRELFFYLVFGVLTTLVNYGCYLLLSPFFEKTTIPTVISQVVSILFAYFTNRTFVFQSKAKTAKAVLVEMAAFFGARLLSAVLDIGIMWGFSDKLGWNDKLVKLGSNVFVIIFNYIASKLVIFRKQ